MKTAAEWIAERYDPQPSIGFVSSPWLPKAIEHATELIEAIQRDALETAAMMSDAAVLTGARGDAVAMRIRLSKPKAPA